MPDGQTEEIALGYLLSLYRFDRYRKQPAAKAPARVTVYQDHGISGTTLRRPEFQKMMQDCYERRIDTIIVYRLDRFGRGGHHRPFNEAGFPAVRIMETNENYTQQHQDLRIENGIEYGDTLEHVNFPYAAKLTALNAVTLASMAAAPPPPAAVSIRGQVSPNTTLSWSKVTGASDYRVHWRLTTSPTWDYSRSAGNVDSFTLENVVIDNYFFGVSSVAEDGSESPVVFPGPAGSFD